MRMIQKKVNHAVGKAIHDYNMILDQENLLVGVSGGKDSLALLNILFSFQKKAPVDFNIFPVYIDLGFENSFSKELEAYVNTHYGTIRIEYTDYGVYAHSEKNKENPCFLCSRLRRKRLFEIAQELGCKKIALGHHKDDIIETFFINMLYAGKLGTMKPGQSFFNDKFKVIRPLSYLEKDEIIKYCLKFNMPDFVSSCPSDSASKRDAVRDMLGNLYMENSHIKGNIFKAMGQVIND
ncbi:MAG: tRNA 2-thiocytidine(32) synthetase TtcA [Desulfobacteraceae bacterium]|nr:tRNA 2-thiocytidine(32) synthetase TtcA [Desulfobacteraceae bacterium]